MILERKRRLVFPFLVLIYLTNQSLFAKPPSEDRGPLELQIRMSETTRNSLRDHRVHLREGGSDFIPLLLKVRLPTFPLRSIKLVLQPIDAKVQSTPGSALSLRDFRNPTQNATFADAKEILLDLADRQPSTEFTLPIDFKVTGQRGGGLELRASFVAVEPNLASEKSVPAGEASIAFLVNPDLSVSERTGSGRILQEHFQKLVADPAEQRRQLIHREVDGDVVLPFDPSKFSQERSQAVELPTSETAQN